PDLFASHSGGATGKNAKQPVKPSLMSRPFGCRLVPCVQAGRDRGRTGGRRGGGRGGRARPPPPPPPPPPRPPPPPAAHRPPTPALSGTPRTIAELPGGLTNRNYLVTTPDGRFVLRAWSDGGALAFNREHEYRNSVIAAEAGVGAPVLDYRPADQALVLGFLP